MAQGFIKYWVTFLLLANNFLCFGQAETAKAIQLNSNPNAGTSVDLSPKFPMEYYTEQGVLYFKTMQSDISVKVQPNYSDLVIRWEWPPWLLLTGFKKFALVVTDVMLKLNPTKYDLLDCRGFETQPFCRCHVVFNYGGIPCPIYEEFTFNNQGEVTFIEAWSDFESLLPMTSGEDKQWSEAEYWGQTKVNRLSTKVPGLGNETGRIDLYSDEMNEAANKDKDIAEMQLRAKYANKFWLQELFINGKKASEGCEVPEGDRYPYYK